MTKKQSAASNATSTVKVIAGVVMVALSLFLGPILASFQEAVCEKDSFGHCTLSSSLIAGIFNTFLPWVIFALGAIFIIIGAVQARKK